MRSVAARFCRVLLALSCGLTAIQFVGCELSPEGISFSTRDRDDRFVDDVQDWLDEVF